MNSPPSALDARLTALREAVAAEVPPPAVDRAVTAAIDRADRRTRRAPITARAWIAWPIGLAAAIALIAFVIRAVPPHAPAAVDPAHAALAQAPAAAFMPLVPIAELERAGDTLVVPARMSRMSLAQFGLPVNPARAADAIDTELLVRPDGAVLALRVIQ